MAYSEFVPVDVTDAADGWETPAGYPTGITRKILHSDLDEEHRTGRRTHLLRFAPGTITTEQFVHTHWEEVLLIDGDLSVGTDEQGRGGHRLQPLCYTRRAPGERHGPFSSRHGCLLLEVHYYP